MTFISRQAKGFYINVLAVIAALFGIAFYLINCNTAYFSNSGINNFQLFYLIAAIVLELGFIISSELGTSIILVDVLPVLVGICFTLSAVLFISSRVYGIASILTFEKNAQTMCDLASALTGIVFCVVAGILSIIASFFKVTK